MAIVVLDAFGPKIDWLIVTSLGLPWVVVARQRRLDDTGLPPRCEDFQTRTGSVSVLNGFDHVNLNQLVELFAGHCPHVYSY